MGNNMTSKDTKKQQEELRLSVSNPIEFEPELSVKTYKSQKLADDIINPIFKLVSDNTRFVLVCIKEYIH